MLASLGDTIAKATLLLLVATGITFGLRRAAAGLRHLVWALALGGLLILPVAAAVMPEWRLSLWPQLPSPVAFQASTGTPAPAFPGATAAAESRAARPVAPAPAATAVADAAIADAGPVRVHLAFDWFALILPLWAGGVLLVLAGIAIGLGRIEWIARTAAPVRDDGWRRLLAALARDLRLERPVRLLQSSGPAMPMTWGVRRPVILLPADADLWPAARRRDVLLHELAHVKRWDFLTQLLARAVCAVYWFHPLVWFAAARLRIERERACDDQVLRSGTKASDYASHLLEIARTLRAAPATRLASVAMARPAQLAGRLLDVLDADRRREVVGLHLAVPAWLVAAGLILPLAAVSPRTNAAPAWTPVPRAAPSVEGLPLPPLEWPAVATAKATPGPRAAVTDSLPGCRDDGSGRRARMSSHTVNNGTMINTSVGRCSVHFVAEGEFTFTEDFSDIATVARGGEVVIEVDYGDHTRALTLTPAGDQLTRVYKVDGREQPFDAAARTWLTETLTYLLRHSGVAAKERSQWILRTRGINGLIDEIAELSSDYARRLYYQAAVTSGKLDPAGFERLVVKAGQEIDSDYELAELLIAIADQQPLTAAMQAGFVTAARTIDSDYEKRRVLDVALSRPGLAPEVAQAMLEVAGSMSSDYELAELLLKLNRARPIDDAVRPAFFTAVNSIQSDYEHSRVLADVVPQQGMSKAMLAATLESAKSITSDYELAELLSKIAGSYVIDESLRPAFFTAVNTIGSDYEHARALKSLLGRDQVAKPVAQAILESAQHIGSDYELAELLIAVARVVRIDDSLRPAFQAAAQGLSSDYERDRVRSALARSSGRAQLD